MKKIWKKKGTCKVCQKRYKLKFPNVLPVHYIKGITCSGSNNPGKAHKYEKENNMSNYLVGKTINKVMIAEDKKAILFITEHENVIVKTDGDCCSETWIEHVELPSLGFPAKVLSVEDIELNKEPQKDDSYECLEFYGCKITTDKGDFIIDYRNESNGYYGGNLSWPGESFYGGVFGQNVSEEEWIGLLEDI